MIEPTPRRRAAGRLLIAAAALALPLTASISYAASDEPAPPAPPAPPAAPELSVSRIVVTPVQGAEKAAGTQKISKIVLIDNKGGEGADESKLSTRTVTREGKTFVFKTSKPLTDEEVEARIKAIESGATFSADSIELKSPSGDPSAANMPPRVSTRTVIVHGKPKSPEEMVKLLELQGSRIECDAPDIKSKAEASGEGQSVRVMVCGKAEGQALAAAADAVRKARERIAKDSRLSEEVRKDILKQLDEEIDRLTKQG